MKMLRKGSSVTRDGLHKQTKSTLWLVGCFALILFVAYPIWFGLWNGLPAAREDAGAWGEFGDFVGGILNPLVALCALYWLTRSIEVQHQELEETRKVLSEQSLTAHKQRFEDTFFALLNQHNEVLNSLSEKEVKNYGAGGKISVLKDVYGDVFSIENESLEEANEMLRSRGYLCGHYFRVLYQLLKLISMRCPETSMKGEFSSDNLLASNPSSEEKLYSNIVRSFLDTEVTQLLAVNCYCEDQGSTYWNYKCLVERYEFLEHMPLEICGSESEIMEEAVDHYLPIAFGKSDFIRPEARGT